MEPKRRRMLELLWHLKPFASLAMPYFRKNRSGYIQIGVLIVLTLMTQLINVVFSYIQRNIFNALVDKNANQFYMSIFQYILILVLAIPITVMQNFFSRRLALDWRRSMTADFIQKYYSDRSYYELELTKASHGIDNPDQRICNDIADFTTISLKFFFILLNSFINLLLFSYVLFQIFPLLYLIVLVYSILGSVITMIVGRTLSDQYYSQIKKEADFRFGVIGTRDNAEAIAFYDINAVFEKTLVWQLFSLVFQIQSQIIFTQLRIESFSKLYEYAAFVIPYLVMASSYFAGNIDAGSILQSNDAFFYIRSDFSVLINNYEELSLFAAGIDRLSELKLALSQDKESLSGDGKNPNKSKSVNGYMSLNIASSHSAMEDSVSSPLLTSDNLSSDFMRGLTERLSTKRIKYNFTTATTIDSDTILSCENLRVCTPDGKRLLGCLSDGSNSVSLSVTTGDRLLITGSSGVGKSSLLRALAGLWTTGTGSVTWHRNSVGNSSSSGNGGVSSTDHLDVKDAIFLPQSAYVGRGTLRQLIQYPSALLDQHHQSSQTDSDDLGSELLWGSESGITQHRSSPIAAYSILTRGLQEDQVLLQILSKVDLLHIAKSIGDGSEVLGLDIVSDLSKTLSAGEKQRLAFARVLFHRPRIAFLDESTSALDVSCEQRLYEELRVAGVTYVSVGHRESLVSCHDRVINLVSSDSAIF